MPNLRPMAMLPLEPTLRVSELLDAVAAVVDDAFEEVWLEGEIRSRRDLRVGGAGPYGARHVYFDLVEPSDDLDRPPVAAISVKLFDSARRRVNAELKRHGSIRMVDGVRVRIRGRVGIYAGRGRVELQMTGIDPGFTLAQLASSRDLVLRALAADGLLDANASLPFPVVPTHIGLVTSAGSAAHADFVHELEVSGLGWRVSLADVRVQGPRAAREVAAAVRELSGRGVDVIAVVRGGGAQTDLAAFDAEIVARAIAGAAVPVLTGIGHEIDTTAADAVAHRAHKTPTACAGSLVAAAHAVHRHAEDTWRAVAGSALRRARAERRSLDRVAGDVATTTRLALAGADARLDRDRAAIAALAERRLLRSASQLALAGQRLTLVGPRLRSADDRLDAATARLRHLAERRIEAAEAAVERAAWRRAAADPERLLRRGWSVTVDPDGRVVRSVHQVAPGTEVRTRVADGTLTATVSAVDADPAPPADRAEPA